jgi:hypothetical protein
MNKPVHAHLWHLHHRSRIHWGRTAPQRSHSLHTFQQGRLVGRQRRWTVRELCVVLLVVQMVEIRVGKVVGVWVVEMVVG